MDWVAFFDAQSGRPKRSVLKDTLLLPNTLTFARPGAQADTSNAAGIAGTAIDALAGLEIHRMVEDDRPGQSAMGPKHWHVFHLIARNPA